MELLQYILDLVLLPRETRLLIKINKIGNDSRIIFKSKTINDQDKLFLISNLQFIIDSIDTVEHKDKKNYWLYMTNAYITVLNKKVQP